MPAEIVTSPIRIARYAYLYLLHMFRVLNICPAQEFHIFEDSPSEHMVIEWSSMPFMSCREERKHSVQIYDSYQLDGCGPNQVRCDDSTCVSQALVCESDFTCKPSLCWCTTQGTRGKLSKYCSNECVYGTCKCAPFMFQCSKGCIPMWQVCDGQSHCQDSSDEFCFEVKPTDLSDTTYPVTRNVLRPLTIMVAGYEVCLGYRCLSGLCISHAFVNDLIPDCPGYEAEDESHALNIKFNGFGYKCDSPGHVPCALNHSKCYDVKMLCVYDNDTLNNLAFCRNGGHLQDCSWVECTNTFKCHESYCIPFRKVCDGIMDCVNGDDELSCSNYICAGFMKCHGSSMCVHPVEVCDDVHHCPAGDDEILCQFQQCPAHCECLAYSIICSGPNLKHIPKLGNNGYRYLSVKFLAKKSLNFANISRQSDLIILDLASTGIGMICSSFKTHCRFFETLAVLNLGNNSIRYIESGCFNPLVNLLHLDLKNNPMVTISNSPLRLDKIRIVNLGNNLMTSLYGVPFEYLHQLQILDLRGILLRYVDVQADKFLAQMSVIITDDYRLCCIYPAVLGCSRIRNLFRYCTRVLPQPYFAPVLQIVGIFIILINVVGLIMYNIKFFHDKLVYSEIVSTMAATEIVKASYLVILSAIDLYHGSHYVLLGQSWADSIFCRILMVSHAVALAMSHCVNIILQHIRYLAVVDINFFLEDHRRRLRIFFWVTLLLALSLFTGIAIIEHDSQSFTSWCSFASFYDNRNSVMFAGLLVLGSLLLCSLSHTLIVYTLICVKVFRVTISVLEHMPENRSEGYWWRMVRVTTKSIKAALIQSAVCLPLIYLIVASLTRISTSQDIAFIVTTIPIITSGCIYPIELLLLNVFQTSKS